MRQLRRVRRQAFSISDLGWFAMTIGTRRLRPQHWKYSDRVWVVEAVALFRGTNETPKDLKAKVLPNRQTHYRAVKGGKGVARIM
jgi:hemolysin-activating ACP:hemolysin acyltransferase